MDSFGDAEILVPCPECSEKVKKPLSWLETHDKLVCPKGHVFDIDSNDLRAARARAEDALDKFKRDVSQTIDIEFKF